MVPTVSIDPLVEFLSVASNCPYCGLRGDLTEFTALLATYRKTVIVFQAKQKHPELPVLVALVGGTGTGKSTVFNALIARSLSRTGVERPKTRGPIVYCHEAHVSIFMRETLLAEYETHHVDIENMCEHETGDPERLTVILHRDPAWRAILLIDSPDVDSITEINRMIALDTYILADALCFITSQEKYGDYVPFQMFRQALHDQKTFIIIMNKMESPNASKELCEHVRREAGRPFAHDRFFTLPWVEAGVPENTLARHEELERLRDILLSQHSLSTPSPLRTHEMQAVRTRLSLTAEALCSSFAAERAFADALAARFQRILADVEAGLLERASTAVDAARKQHMQSEVSRIFRRYDLLRKPRQFVIDLITSPLSLFGYRAGRNADQRRKDLEKIHRKIDVQPLHAAIHTYNRNIHQELLGPGYCHIREMLLNRALTMSTEEIDSTFFHEQAALEHWLDATFTEMAKGIPKSKEWGIYSTTLLWGIFLVSVEAVIGGGLTLFEVVLDSFIMPLISKGAAELFAYSELKKLGQELDSRYKAQLCGVLRVQHDRYLGALNTMVLTASDLDRLNTHLAAVKDTLRALHYDQHSK